MFDQARTLTRTRNDGSNLVKRSDQIVRPKHMIWT